MFHKNLKLFLATLIVCYAVYLFTIGSIGNGIMLILLSGVLVFLYFKNEFILLAFLRIRKQDFDGTRKWLHRIKKPESALIKKQQGYYNYLLGLMASQTNFTEAERHLRRAIKLGLSMSADLAMAKLSLAGIMLQKRKKREATELLSEAKKLDKQNILAGEIKQMQQYLKKI